MSRRSNRSRGGRVLSRGTALRARQMTPGGSRPTRGSVVPGMFPDSPDIQEEALLFTESGTLIATEDGIWMAAQ